MTSNTSGTTYSRQEMMQVALISPPAVDAGNYACRLMDCSKFIPSVEAAVIAFVASQPDAMPINHMNLTTLRRS